MIRREAFLEKYDVHLGDDVLSARESSRTMAMKRLNTFRANNPKVKIISIQESKFDSNDVDDSPFWVKLTIFFEDAT